nr:uncharacterized protein LOC111427997 isoform X1 [Onthophagus taurus]
MEESNSKPPKLGVSQIKKIVSKVIVITPKQIAEMGLQNQLKNVKMGTVIGQIPEAKTGDGTSTGKKPVKAALLSNLRTKMSTLLNHSPFVMQVDPKDTVDLVYESVDDEACDAAEVIEIVNDKSKSEKIPEKEIKEKKKIEVLNDQVVHYSSDDLDLMLERVQKKHAVTKPIIQKTVILNNNKILQKKIVSKSSSDSENLLYVPDLPEAAAASQITSISSSDSDRELSPEKDDKNDVSVKKNLIDLDALIAAKKVITDAAIRTVPESFNPSALKGRQILRTYSKIQSFSVVGNPTQRESINKRIIRIHKRGSKRRSDDEDEEWVSPKRPYNRQKKFKDTTSTEQELQTSVEEKVRRIMDECKGKETVEQVVAPKKRGRPRKTPLQPKVDVEPPSDGDKERNNTSSDKPEIVTPRKRGRPRKIYVDPGRDDKTSDDNSPKKKQRRRKSDADEREFSAPSSTPGGVRTSGRKRKVVDYAALSGGRISSSEEEDFAEIERLTGTSIKHDSSEDESSEEEEEEEEIPREDEDKEKSTSKMEAVHPLKKRLKMEHAQAAEKEKADEDEKKDNGSNKHENNDVQNNSTVKETKEPPKTEEKDNKENSQIKQKTQNLEKENETSIHKNDSNDNNDSAENSESDKNSTSDEKDSQEIERKDNDNVVEKKDSNDSKVEKNDQEDDEKDVEKVESDKPEEESDNEDNTITCGVCKETLDSESGWVKHKQGRHNNLAWKVGEPPLDLENYDLVYKTLKVTLKQYGALVCEVCGEDYSSAVKFIKHARKCKNKVCFDFEKRARRFSSSKASRSFADADPGTSSADGEVINNVPKVVKKKNDKQFSQKKSGSNTNPQNDVKCAVCEKSIPKRQWSIHKSTKHNNLAWKDGDEPLDLDDTKLVTKLLTQLCKQKKVLTCELCGAKKKSAVGYISHKQQCQKSIHELDALKVECKICYRRMLPVSLGIHMQLSHSAKEAIILGDKQEDVLTPRKAAMKAINSIKKFREKEKDLNQTAISKKFIKNFDFTTSNDDVMNKFKSDIETHTFTNCIYSDCSFKSETVEDLCKHLNICDKKIEGNIFTCNFCLKTFINRKEVGQHIKTHDETDCYVIKDVDDDENFEADGEEEIDPFDDIEIDKMNSSLSKGVTKSVGHKVKFMEKINFHKKSWNVFSFAYKWTKEFADHYFAEKDIFAENGVDKDQFKSIKNEDIFFYLPKQTESIDVSRLLLDDLKNPLDQDFNWRKYKLFESDISSDGTSTIFCGGKINCLVWIPTPHTHLNENQILSISVLNPEKSYLKTINHYDKSLIQFWNFGPLKNGENSKFKPKLEFCLGHKYGLITNLEWCPSGYYDPFKNNDEVQRLGLIAVATGDKFVYIYSICQPRQKSGKLFEKKPLVKLSLTKSVDANIGEIEFFPTKTSWTKAKGHKYIAVGYSNGIVAIFSLEKMFIEEVLYPLKCFSAECESISALLLTHHSNGNQFLITASTFKDMKLWDLNDTSDCIFISRKYPITELTCSIHWLIPLVCYDNTTTVASWLVPFREHNCDHEAITFTVFNSTVTSVTSNDWGNLFISCSDTGEVVICMADQLYDKYDYDLKKVKPRFLLSYTGIYSKKLTKDENKAIQKNKLNQLKKKGLNPEDAINFGPRTYEDVKNRYGLIFCDMDTNLNIRQGSDGPSKKHDKFLNDFNYHSINKVDLYPMQSISKAVLNQNAQSFHHYALGYQVGFVRVSRVSFLNKSLCK